MGFWEPLFFWILAAGALVTSFAVLFFRNPLYSALALIADFFCFAGLYVLLSAHFLAITQILVYGGAIMVLFLFIIMLLNLSDEDLGARRFSFHHVLAIASGAAIFLLVASSVVAVVDFDEIGNAIEAAEQQSAGQDGEDAVAQAVNVPSGVPGLDAFNNEEGVNQRFANEIAAWDRGDRTYATGKYPRFDESEPFVVPPVLVETQQAHAAQVRGADVPIGARGSDEHETGSQFGTVEPISLLLVNRFVVPFELTAVLLLAAIIGAVIIAKKRL